MNYQILINKRNGLDKDYVPSNLVEVDSKYKKGIKLEENVYHHWLALKDRISKEGYTIEIESGYRSYDYQDKLLQELTVIKGEEYAKKIAAIPGYSEHQTGLALDYCLFRGKRFIIEHEMDKYAECFFTNKIASEYGFILRYPKGKEDITGYQYEPWHLRYVGKDLAIHLYKKNITLDEYFEEEL